MEQRLAKNSQPRLVERATGDLVSRNATGIRRRAKATEGGGAGATSWNVAPDLALFRRGVRHAWAREKETKREGQAPRPVHVRRFSFRALHPVRGKG